MLPNNLDSIFLVLLIAEHEWDGEQIGQSTSRIYKILAEGQVSVISLPELGMNEVASFLLKHAKVRTLAVRVPIGLVETALITRTVLEAFKPSVIGQIGFGGILSDDLRLGDVAVATQVDCYLTKNKAAGSAHDLSTHGTDIMFAGEVFRPSLSLVQQALNLKYAFPELYKAYQSEVQAALPELSFIHDPAHEVTKFMRSKNVEIAGTEVSEVHAVHFACAEIVSASSKAIKWLRKRDRKVAIIDMESGGMLAAAWEYCHRNSTDVATFVIRGGGSYGDERHVGVIQRNAKEIYKFAFENACKWLTRLMQAHRNQTDLEDCRISVDIGILIPLEEEFSYFMDLLSGTGVGRTIRPIYRSGRYYYIFQINQLICAATFVGDMGLVRMGLTTQDLYQGLSPKMLVMMGIAAGFSGRDCDLKICDVAIAREIDLYFHRAKNPIRVSEPDENLSLAKLAELREEEPIKTSSEVISFIFGSEGFRRDRLQWKRDCETEIQAVLKPLIENKNIDLEMLKVATSPTAYSVRLASGEFVAASTNFVEALMDRGCNAVDMEAGGAAVAYQRIYNISEDAPKPMLLVIRGISDRGDEVKSTVESTGLPNMFRRASMRNAARLALALFMNSDFASMINPD